MDLVDMEPGIAARDMMPIPFGDAGDSMRYRAGGIFPVLISVLSQSEIQSHALMSENDASDALPYEFNSRGQMIVRIKMSRIRYGARLSKASRSRSTPETTRRGQGSSHAGSRARVRARAGPSSNTGFEATRHGETGRGEGHPRILQCKAMFSEQRSDTNLDPTHHDDQKEGSEESESALDRLKNRGRKRKHPAEIRRAVSSHSSDEPGAGPESE